MSRIGIHVSIAGGVHKALQRAEILNVNAVQIFLKNARKWKSPGYKDREIERFHNEKQKFEDLEIFAHAGYLVDLADKGVAASKSYKSLLDDFRRAESLGIKNIVVHPGNHKDK